MRQRLAIALAILDRPDFLILDEPINGLDPVGIKEMRALIKTLRDQFGMTILISSHILSELEMVVDRYIIMHQGKVIKELSKQALDQELEEQLYLQAQDKEQTSALLKDHQIPYHLNGDYLVLPTQTDVMDLVKLLIQHDLAFNEIFKQQITFENFYLTLIQEGQ